jgi:phosphodiesterase/alkaline phosphatase D-like protein
MEKFGIEPGKQSFSEARRAGQVLRARQAMKTRIQLVFVLAMFLLGAIASGQENQVRITKGPVVEHTDATTAVIAWSTNISSSSVVKYGSDQSNLDRTAQMPWGALTHRVTIKNLEPGKTYFFQVNSSEGRGSGTSAVSSVGQFSTSVGNSQSAQPQAGAPHLEITNGPVVERVAETSATVE